jgi:hypothetical protein
MHGAGGVGCYVLIPRCKTAYDSPQEALQQLRTLGRPPADVWLVVNVEVA